MQRKTFDLFDKVFEAVLLVIGAIGLLFMITAPIFDLTLRESLKNAVLFR